MHLGARCLAASGKSVWVGLFKIIVCALVFYFNIYMYIQYYIHIYIFFSCISNTHVPYRKIREWVDSKLSYLGLKSNQDQTLSQIKKSVKTRNHFFK